MQRVSREQQDQQSDEYFRKLEEELPSDLDAEKATLGAILLGGMLDGRIDELLPDYYHDPRNAIICSALRDLLQERGAGYPLDATMLRSALSAAGKLNTAGGAEYVVSLTEVVPTQAHFDAHLAIVKSNSALRELVYSSRDWVRLAPRNVTTPESLLDSVAKRATELSEKASSGKSGALIHILDAYIKAADRVESIAAGDSALALLKTGYVELDKLIGGLPQSEMTIIAGRPGMGKSSAGLGMATNVVRAELARCARTGESPRATLFISNEMPSVDLVLRQACSDSNMDLAKLREGVLAQSDFDGMAASANTFTQDTPYFFYDVGNAKLSTVRTLARDLQRRYGLLAVFIDYLQILRPERHYNSKVDEVGALSNGVKALAMEFKCPFVALAQLNRECEGRPSKVPELGDMRGAGDIEQDAALVLAVMRPELYAHQNKDYATEEYRNIGCVHVLKQRNGPLGEVRLHFRKSSASFHNLAKDVQGQYAERDVPGSVATIAEGYASDDYPAELRD